MRKQINNREMRKAILVVVLAMVSLASCNKEEVKPNEEQVEEVVDCNCGTIIMSYPLNDWRNQIRVRNICTDNVKEKSTIETHLGPGDEICFDEPW